MALDLKLEDTFTFKQGEKKNRDKMILSLYRNLKLNIGQIAIAAEVPEQYVIDVLKAEKITSDESEIKKGSKSRGKK